MGIITDRITDYHDNKLTFAELEAFLLSVKWKEPGWMSKKPSDFATREEWSDWKDGFDICEEGTWGEVACARPHRLLSDSEYLTLHKAVVDSHARTKEVDIEDIVPKPFWTGDKWDYSV